MTNNVLRILLLDDTIGKFFLLEAFVHIRLPLIEEVPETVLSRCTMHRIDVCPYRRIDVCPYFMKSSTMTNNVLRIPLLDDTIGKFFLLETFVHIRLPLIEEVPATVRSRCTMHRIDVCPYRRIDVCPYKRA